MRFLFDKGLSIMMISRDFIESRCCPLKGIDIYNLPKESTRKKVYYLVIFNILNIVLLPIRGLINILLIPVIILHSSCGLAMFSRLVACLIVSLMVVPIIGHILTMLFLVMRGSYKKQASCLDNMVYFTLRPHDFTINYLIEFLDPR